MKPLGIEGAFVIEPHIYRDDRGSFHEWFRDDSFTEAAGHHFRLSQANCSASHQGVIRGIHFTDVPPGQTKYVTCVKGKILDVVVDLREGSPTFGRWESVCLDEANRAVFITEGLGHAFMALTDAVLVYLCSEPYDPASERIVNPLDHVIGISWPSGGRTSPRDTQAPSFTAMRKSGLLPRYGGDR